MKKFPGSEFNQHVNVHNSPILRIFSKVSNVKKSDQVDSIIRLDHVRGMEKRFSTNSDRKARLCEVKDQIENGSYAVDPEKVASSLVKYIQIAGMQAHGSK